MGQAGANCGGPGDLREGQGQHGCACEEGRVRCCAQPHTGKGAGAGTTEPHSSLHLSSRDENEWLLLV